MRLLEFFKKLTSDHSRLNHNSSISFPKPAKNGYGLNNRSITEYFRKKKGRSFKMENKLTGKHPEAKGFLRWINLANEAANLSRPPCYTFRWERGWLRIHSWRKRALRHLIFCRFFHPWKHLPHKFGQQVEPKKIDEFLTAQKQKEKTE